MNKAKKSILVITWSQNSLSKNFIEIIFKQRIRVTQFKNTFSKEMTIIKMFKEKRERKVK